VLPVPLHLPMPVQVRLWGRGPASDLLPEELRLPRSDLE